MMAGRGSGPGTGVQMQSGSAVSVSDVNGVAKFVLFSVYVYFAAFSCRKMVKFTSTVSMKVSQQSVRA